QIHRRTLNVITQIVNSKNMQTTEIEKSKTHILIEIIEYVPNSVVSKTIIRKTTGNISIVAIDIGEALAEKISPFDTYIQVIEGVAEVVIDEKSNILQTGQAIIIPAHASNIVKANERFKMISTVIKSGYEESSL
ncbi:MAG: cupin domain-containing protein, partial [Anaerolineales bacterium]